MGTYQLYVKTNGRWAWICDIQAQTHPEAFRKAMLNLDSDHYDKPIRLEQTEPKRDEQPGSGNA